MVMAAVLVAAPVLMAQAPAPAVVERNWHQWRGPYANGISKTATPPLEWSETKNIKWKAPIPGRGSSTPVIWGDKIFVLTAVPVGVTGDAQHAPRGGLRPRGVHKFTVLAYDRQTGKVVWERVAREQEPHEASHNDNGTWASSSAVTDGEHVIASFESQGIYAYDMNGKLVWQKDLGDKRVRNEFGEGSTPTLHGKYLVVVWDHQGESFVGTPRYQVQRIEGVPNVFASPVGAAGRVYVVGREGTTAVLKDGPSFEVIATNTLDDHFDASPALVDREMFLRGMKYLYCLAH